MVRPVLRWSVCLAVIAPLWLLSAGAHADVIDPAEEACGKVGEACSLGDEQGVCVADTCSRLDYSNMEPGGTPGTEEYECVLCKPGAPAADPEPTPAPADEKKAVDEKAVDEHEAAKTADEPPPTSKGSRCAVGPSTSTVSLLLGLGLLGLVVRRRA